LTSTGLTTVLLTLQHLGPFKKQAHGHGQEDEKSLFFSILVVISLVGTVSGKSLKLLPPDVIF